MYQPTVTSQVAFQDGPVAVGPAAHSLPRFTTAAVVLLSIQN